MFGSQMQSPLKFSLEKQCHLESRLAWKEEFIQRVKMFLYHFPSKCSFTICPVIFLGRKIINGKNLFHTFQYHSSFPEEGRVVSTSGNQTRRWHSSCPKMSLASRKIVRKSHTWALSDSWQLDLHVATHSPWLGYPGGLQLGKNDYIHGEWS